MTARKPEAFIFDLDGTIYLGDKIIPGAKETLQWLREKELKIRFVTNNPRFSSSFYTNKLNRLGIEAQECEVINSAQLTAQYIKNNPKYGKIFVIGEDPLKKELAAKYIPMVKDGHPDTVLVSFDTMLTYEKLQFAYQSLKNGSNFIATNPDAVCPTPGGGLVDAGAIIAALEAATGRKVERVIGKPSELMADLVVKQLNVTPDKCIVVGDRLNTDVALGKKAGMQAVWINTDNKEIPTTAKYIPDYIIESIKNLPYVLSDEFQAT